MEAVQLQYDPIQDLREAVFSVQTNYVFKRALRNINKRRMDRSSRKEFIKLFSVDVQNVEPIYFNGQKYSVKLHKNNLFLFLNRDFEIIGILKGSSWYKEWEKFENYSARKSWHNKDSKAVIKNRINMEAIATHILMITPDMQIDFKKKHNSKPFPRFISKDEARRKLNKRLYEYKLKKHESFNHNQIMDKTKELITLFTNSLFDKEKEKQLLAKKLSFRSSFINSVPNLIEDVARLSEKYWDNYQRLQKAKHVYGNQWAKETVESIKIELISYFKAYLEEEE